MLMLGQGSGRARQTIIRGGSRKGDGLHRGIPTASQGKPLWRTLLFPGFAMREPRAGWCQCWRQNRQRCSYPTTNVTVLCQYHQAQTMPPSPSPSDRARRSAPSHRGYRRRMQCSAPGPSGQPPLWRISSAPASTGDHVDGLTVLECPHVVHGGVQGATYGLVAREPDVRRSTPPGRRAVLNEECAALLRGRPIATDLGRHHVHPETACHFDNVHRTRSVPLRSRVSRRSALPVTR